jgi:hypothetical protein
VNRHPAITLLVVVAIAAAAFLVYSVLRSLANGVNSALGLPARLWDGIKADASALAASVSGFVTGDAPTLVTTSPLGQSTYGDSQPPGSIPSVFSDLPQWTGIGGYSGILY